MSTEPVIILLSSFNGELYLDEQFESIIRQSYTNWKLLVRDDGSSDNTLKILNKYLQQDSRINLITDDKGNLGAVQSFGLLLNYAKENKYIMFCDQDDVWLNDKIELTLNEMLLAEKKYGTNSPLLVYTNFSYVDEHLQIIQSKKNYSATKVKHLQLNHLIVQNPVYGCTMMINNQLLKIVDNIPDVAENHDYWIALVASAFGDIIYLNKKTVLYRQHRANISGNYDNDSFRKRFQRIFQQRKNFKDLQSNIDMGMAFREKYLNQLNTKQKNIIDDFIAFVSTKKLKLLKKNLANGIRRQTFSQTVLLYLSMLLHKVKNV